jgi:hypothetical protein
MAAFSARRFVWHQGVLLRMVEAVHDRVAGRGVEALGRLHGGHRLRERAVVARIAGLEGLQERVDLLVVALRQLAFQNGEPLVDVGGGVPELTLVLLQRRRIGAAEEDVLQLLMLHLEGRAELGGLKGQSLVVHDAFERAGRRVQAQKGEPSGSAADEHRGAHGAENLCAQ